MSMIAGYTYDTTAVPSSPLNEQTFVRKRFGQWILDTCNRPYDQTWLDYQHEIGLRHHRSKKSRW